jgi:hypothetical protein
MISDEHIRELMRAAIDQAFQKQVATLFINWCVDRTGQPERAAKGARIAIDVYRQAIKTIDTVKL